MSGILFGYLSGGSLPDALRELGFVGALAGITAGLIGVLNERFKRRQSTA